MTLVNLKSHPAERNFNNVVDTFLNGFPSVFRDDFATPDFKLFAPVNVKEVENGYQLDVVAPGMEKEDFKISLDKNLLTVSAEKKDETKNEKQLRREYKFQSFKRSFTLDEHIDAENIDAKYVNGVLVLTLPKKADVKPATKQISIQ